MPTKINKTQKINDVTKENGNEYTTSNEPESPYFLQCDKEMLDTIPNMENVLRKFNINPDNLPVHGSFSKPTVTLNILAYSNTSSLLTHLTTFNTIPFKLTYILFLFLFIPFTLFYLFIFFNPNFTKCTWLYIPYVLIMHSRPPRMAPSMA